jgi:endonuclease YncB( thermonuclease family)
VQSIRHFVNVTLVVAMLLFATGCANRITYKVVSVADGDTITVVRDQATKKVRLAGIDAPEKDQPFGRLAKEFLSMLVFGKDVELETNKKDRYGRDVGKVYFEGRDVSLAMLTAGLAWHYKKYQGEQSAADRLRYSNAELDAQSQSLGLWQVPVRVAPWSWRANQR